MIIMVSGLAAFGQSGVTPAMDPLSEERLARVDFHGKPAVVVHSDSIHVYILTDLALLPDRFARIWYLSNVAATGKIVNLELDPDSDGGLCMSRRDHEAEKLLNELTRTLENARATSESWTETEKEVWLRDNDKFQSNREK